MGKLPGVASLKTDQGTILLINLDSKEWRDAYEVALKQMNSPTPEGMKQVWPEVEGK